MSRDTGSAMQALSPSATPSVALREAEVMAFATTLPRLQGCSTSVGFAVRIAAGVDGRTLAGPRRFAGAHPDAYAVFGAEGRAAEEARRRYPFGLGAQ